MNSLFGMNGAASSLGWALPNLWMGLCGVIMLCAVPAVGRAPEVSEGAAHSRASDQGLLLVANKNDHALGIIDPAAGKQVASVPVEGVTGHEVAASPDGRLAFVPIYGNSGVGGAGTDGEVIRVVDLDQRRIIHTIDYGKGVRPHCALFGPKDGLLYVTAELDNSISIINPRTFKFEGSIPTGHPESHMLAITPDGRRGYTSNVGSGTVSVLDMEARRQVGTIKVADRAQRISISTDGKLAFTADQDQKRLAVIDTGLNAVSGWIELPGKGYGTAPTPDGRWLVVALPGVSKVAAVDLHSMSVAHSVDVPKAPQEVLVSPSGRVAYVSCDASGAVAVIDTDGWKVEREIKAGAGADGLAWAARPKPILRSSR